VVHSTVLYHVTLLKSQILTSSLVIMSNVWELRLRAPDGVRKYL